MNLDELYKARYVLNGIIRRTDLVQAPRLNPDADIYLKPENLQVTGSFKVRGACYKISQLSDEEKAIQHKLDLAQLPINATEVYSRNCFGRRS